MMKNKKSRWSTARHTSRALPR